MSARKKVLALIPARGGSKGLPQKNIRPLCGKPLIAWTIQSALNSELIDDVVVSTDDEKIADISKQFGAQVPFLRPAELATDTASSVAVAFHALDFLTTEQKKTYDYLLLLEPTSPLREPGDLDAMIRKLQALLEMTSVVTLGEVHHHPYLSKTVQGDEMKDLFSGPEKTFRRQDLPKAYFPFGVGYLVSVPAFYEEKTFYTRHCSYFEIQRHQCYEIDDIYDFVATESIMNHLLQSGQRK